VENERRFREILRRQHEVFTRSQANECGYSTGELNRDLKRSRVERVYPGVYRITNRNESNDQRIQAALLWAGPRAAISHGTAAWLWGLDKAALRWPLHVVVDSAGVRSPNGKLCAHWAKKLDRALIRGFSVTTLARTVLDLTRVETPKRLAELFESARRKDDDFVADLVTTIRENTSRHHDPTLLLKMIEERKGSVANDSRLEDDVLARIIEWKLPLPLNQVQLVHEGEPVIVADFAWPEAHLVLHCDGGFHLDLKQKAIDERQRTLLGKLGVQQVFVGRSTLFENYWLDAIQEHLKQERPVRDGTLEA
jgi:hypothetical protein